MKKKISRKKMANNDDQRKSTQQIRLHIFFFEVVVFCIGKHNKTRTENFIRFGEC